MGNMYMQLFGFEFNIEPVKIKGLPLYITVSPTLNIQISNRHLCLFV